MLMRDVRGGQALVFTEELWSQMLRCQGGAHLKDSLIFQVTDFHAANELLRVFPGLTWELLFVAICESRQACSSFADGGRTFTAMLATVGAQKHRFTRIINSLTEHLVHRGVTQSSCLFHSALHGIVATSASYGFDDGRARGHVRGHATSG